MRRFAYRLGALAMLSVSRSPPSRSTRYRSTSSAALIAPLMSTLWCLPSAVSSAVVLMSPTSLAGLSAGSATSAGALRSTLAPPAVLTVIAPSVMPAGTTSVINCWSGLLASPSTTVCRLKLPTVRPSMLMTRSSCVSPVPSSTTVLPEAMTPPTALIVGTTCKPKLALLPSTVTAPDFASAGTTTLSTVPFQLPVRVSVPSRPVSSMPRNCTSVLLLMPWPVSWIVCPVTAEGLPASSAVPRLALALMPANTAMGCSPKAQPAISAQPPSVLTRIGPSSVRGATIPSRLLLLSISMGLSLVMRSCCTTPPTVMVVAPSMKPDPLR